MTISTDDIARRIATEFRAELGAAWDSVDAASRAAALDAARLAAEVGVRALTGQLVTDTDRAAIRASAMNIRALAANVAWEGLQRAIARVFGAALAAL